MKEFRQTNDARLEKKPKKEESKVPLDQMSFGKPNRPSTPISGVISNYYGETAVAEISEKYQIQEELVRLKNLTDKIVEEAI